jgi:hypothetical protein
MAKWLCYKFFREENTIYKQTTIKNRHFFVINHGRLICKDINTIHIKQLGIRI